MFPGTVQSIQLISASTYSLLNNLFSFAIYLSLVVWTQPFWIWKLCNATGFQTYAIFTLDIL